MTNEQTALSRRVVACKGWRWMPGMLAYFEHDGRRVRVTDPACWVSTTALPDVTDAATMREWAETAAKAENENAEDAKRERAAVVAWLRDEEYHILALAIERGEHRREENE